MKKTILFFTAAFMLCSGASAQWKKLTIKFTNGLELNDVYASGNKIIAVGTNADFATGKFIGQMLVSRDGGQSWDTMQNTSGKFFKTIAFRDDNTGFIAGYGSISFMLRTDDGGETWTTDMLDYEHTGITDMHFFNDKVGVAVGYGSDQFFSGNSYKTTDGGETWTPSEAVEDSLPLQNMFFVNENLGYGVASFFGFKTFAKTTDGGAHWELVYSHDHFIEDIHFWNETEGILVDYSGVFKTYDGGKTWVDKTTTTIKNKNLSSVTFFDRFTGFAVGLGGGIFKTRDGGETWTKELSPTTQDLLSVEIHDGKVFAVGRNGVVLRSSETLGNPENIKPALTVSAYPNPASSKLFVSVPGENQDEISVRLMDINGRIAVGGGTGRLIDVSELPDGIYIVEASGPKSMAMCKVLIRR